MLLPLLVAFALPLQIPSETATVGTAAAEAPLSTAPVAPVLRVALQEPDVDGVPARVGRVFASQLVREIRKLDRTTVVSMDEMRALLEQEATRQLSGCGEGSCVGEIAEALGADELVVARLSRVGGEHVLSVRRLDAQHPGVVQAFEKRFAARDGEEFLTAVGPVVKELWADRPLAKGARRGVDKEVARRLNPPPLGPGTFIGALASSALLATGGAGAALVSSIIQDQTQALLDESTSRVIDGKDIVARQGQANAAAWSANGLFIGAGALAVATGISFFFTDFEGAGSRDE